LQGDVDTAIENLKSTRAPREAPVALQVPLRITGTTHDEMLVADRADFVIVDAQGRVLYEGSALERHSVALLPDPAEPSVALQKFEIPGGVSRRIAPQSASLIVDYSLTVRAVVAQHRIPVADAEVRSPEIGVCQ